MPKKGLARGIYETEYGNAAYVAGPAASRAYDLDAAEWIPLELVTENFLRDAEDSDDPDDADDGLDDF